MLHPDWSLCLRVHRGRHPRRTEFAAAAEQAGQNTLIVDLDDKGSAEAGSQLREAETPRLVRIGSWKAPEAKAAAKSGGYA